jgi:hypothetical protein
MLRNAIFEWQKCSQANIDGPQQLSNQYRLLFPIGLSSRQHPLQLSLFVHKLVFERTGDV